MLSLAPGRGIIDRKSLTTDDCSLPVGIIEQDALPLPAIEGEHLASYRT